MFITSLLVVVVVVAVVVVESELDRASRGGRGCVACYIVFVSKTEIVSLCSCSCPFGL